MAMINDKGPEESRDTDATYIILSHQSVHLPGPSRQEAGGAGGVGWGVVGGEVRGRSRKRQREREMGGGLYLLSVLSTEELLLSFFSQREEKGGGGEKKKNK